MDNQIMNTFKADDGNFIEFDRRLERDEIASAAAGCAQHRNVDWVIIKVPGSRDVSEFKMSEGSPHRIRYEKQYKEWIGRVDKGETGVLGMAISAWPQVDRAQAENLKSMGVYSVEMLADIQDTHLHRFGPNIRKLRTDAQNFLAVAKQNAPIQNLTERLERKDAQIQALTDQVAELSRLVREQGGTPQTATPAPAAPGVDIAALVNAAVAAALAAKPEKKSGWPKGKPRKPAAQEEAAA